MQTQTAPCQQNRVIKHRSTALSTHNRLLWYQTNPRQTKITTRTKLLAALTLVLLLAAGTIAHRRLTLCKMQIHPGSHRTPIPGASGDPADFGCKLLAPATATEKSLDLALCVAALALLRSVWIDTHARQQDRPLS